MHVCLCALTSESFTARALLFPREGRSAGCGTASPKPLPDAVTALHYCPFLPLLISAPWSQLVCGTNFKERDDLITALYSCLYWWGLKVLWHSHKYLWYEAHPFVLLLFLLSFIVGNVYWVWKISFSEILSWGSSAWLRVRAAQWREESPEWLRMKFSEETLSSCFARTLLLHKQGSQTGVSYR